MDTTANAILVALGLLILFALVFKGRISVSLLGMDFKTKSDSQRSNAGTSIRDAQAGGNITANDQTGRGAEISRAKAGGNITASSSAPLKPSPESPAPGTPAAAGTINASQIAAGGNVSITNIGQLVQLSQNYVRSPLHQLPSLNEHFTGRTAELKTLCEGIRQRVREGKPTAIVSAIEGLGGVGKTELAVAAAYMLVEDFPEAQIILQLAAHSTSPATPAQVRDDLLHMVHGDAKLPEDDGALWKLYQDIFREDNGQPRRMLVILDDVAGDNQVRALLPPPGCAVLITSRRALECGEPLRLTKFPRAEAIALLRSFRADLTEADAGAVAEQCGFLAIALQAAGGFLKRHVAKPAAEYIAELRNDRLKRLHHTDTQFDVNVVFERSLRDMTAPQRAAFHRLSVMAHGFDREAALAVAGSNGDDLDELVALNLLEFHPPTQRFDWHDLLRAFAAKGLTPEEELVARINHACRFTAVAARANELYKTRGKTLDGLAMFDRERRHIEAAFEFLHSVRSGGLRPPSENSAVQPAVRDRRYSKEAVVAACRQLVVLVDAVAYTSGLRFHPRHQLIPWLEAQLAAAREIGDRQNEGIALGNLGIAYAALGDARKAIEYYEQRLVIAREIGDRRGECNALG
ncbi:MAG: tetratricopeptide repeat protein, partial [Verrucomicrobiia bacterium]